MGLYTVHVQIAADGLEPSTQIKKTLIFSSSQLSYTATVLMYKDNTGKRDCTDISYTLIYHAVSLTTGSRCVLFITPFLHSITKLA